MPLDQPGMPPAYMIVALTNMQCLAEELPETRRDVLLYRKYVSFIPTSDRCRS